MTNSTLVQSLSRGTTAAAAKGLKTTFVHTATPGSAGWARAVRVFMEKAAVLDALHETQRHFALSGDELDQVLTASNRADRLVGAIFSPFDDTLLLFTGSFKRLHVPLSWFAALETTAADPTRLKVTNAGHTFQFGRREAPAKTLVEVFSDPTKQDKSRVRSVKLSALSLAAARASRTPYPGASFLDLSPLGL
jgi:hypothetical protein